MIVVVDGGHCPGQAFNRRGHAALELVIVITVEKVVFAIILILHDRLNRTQPFFQKAAFRLPFLARAIGIAAPDKPCFRQIVAASPAILVDQRLQTRTISARLRSENAVASAPFRRLRVGSACHKARLLRLHAGGNGVVLHILIQRADGSHGLVEKRDLFRERIAEKA